MTLLSSNQATYVSIDARKYLYFGGTNYLGLAHRPELLQAACRSFERFGLSSGASRLTSGENELLMDLEKEFASFAGVAAALVLPAGFMSNQCVVESIEKEVDAWLISEHAHASIQAAVRQSRKPVFVETNVFQDLRLLKSKHGIGQNKVLAVFAEPVSALAGELGDLVGLASTIGGSDYLILDEAQSMGVLGKSGRGGLEHFSLRPDERLIRTGTFSKAFGSYGGFVLSSHEIAGRIRALSQTFRGSTSLPPFLCAAISEALRILINDPGSTINSLAENIAFVNEGLSKFLAPAILEKVTPIYYLEHSDRIEHVSTLALESGIYIPSVQNYFPAQSRIGLRFTIQAGHSKEELKRLLDLLTT